MYEGDFSKGMKEGNGKLLKIGKESKHEYDGQWKEDEKNGDGKYTIFRRKLWRQGKDGKDDI